MSLLGNWQLTCCRFRLSLLILQLTIYSYTFRMNSGEHRIDLVEHEHVLALWACRHFSLSGVILYVKICYNLYIAR